MLIGRGVVGIKEIGMMELDWEGVVVGRVDGWRAETGVIQSSAGMRWPMLMGCMR